MHESSGLDAKIFNELSKRTQFSQSHRSMLNSFDCFAHFDHLQSADFVYFDLRLNFCVGVIDCEAGGVGVLVTDSTLVVSTLGMVLRHYRHPDIERHLGVLLRHTRQR